ncbi:MAG: hypothetical protein JWN92_1682, partial [Candidatus Acidoferrum typicum]|nr:hypothetical protein [Candidatus Acidoferrum typicum]
VFNNEIGGRRRGPGYDPEQKHKNDQLGNL